MENSNIEWTDHTANFWWGCFKVSPGCQHCYAETLSNRFSPGIWGPAKTTNRELKGAAWKDIPRWNRQAQKDGQRKRVFVMSMGDFFEDHPRVDGWRWDAMGIMEASTMLDFQVLTKRPENVLSMVPDEWRLEHWPAHIWIGTSVENQQTADERIPELLKIPAAVRFLSMEPLLGAVDLSTIRFVVHELSKRSYSDPGHEVDYRQPDGSHPKIDWVIVGGESGPNARPMHPDWARSLRDQCVASGVPFFFKQWGGWIPICELEDSSNYSYEKRVRTPLGWGWKEEYRVPIGCLHGNDGQFTSMLESDYRALRKPMMMYRVGKKAAGRQLDGREWNEMPTTTHVPK